DCETARQQTDGVEDRCLEHVARSRSCEALSDVVEIGNDENREDGRLGDDERGHTNRPTIRETPSFGRFKGWRRDCICRAHRLLTFFLGPPHSLVATVRIFRMLQIPQRPATSDYRYGCKVVCGWWGAYGPFESPCVPGIIPCESPFPIRNN